MEEGQVKKVNVHQIIVTFLKLFPSRIEKFNLC